jgi:hypothetical protein
MSDSNDPRLLDKRVVHRYLRKGILDEKEYERLVKGLPDLADRALPIEASMDGDEIDDLDDDEDADDEDEAQP